MRKCAPFDVSEEAARITVIIGHWNKFLAKTLICNLWPNLSEILFAENVFSKK